MYFMVILIFRFIIPPRFYSAFCKLIAKMGITEAERHCEQFINHNNFFIDPRTVVQYGIPVFSVGFLLELEHHFVQYCWNRETRCLPL